jgi:hypothetical protein
MTRPGDLTGLAMPAWWKGFTWLTIAVTATYLVDSVLLGFTPLGSREEYEAFAAALTALALLGIGRTAARLWRPAAAEQEHVA